MARELQLEDFEKTHNIFDIRALFIISFILGFAAFLISKPLNSIVLILASLGLLLYLKKYRRIFVFLFITVFFVSIYYLIQNLSASLIKDLFGLSFVFTLKFVPMLIVASIITHDLPTGAVIEALSRMRLPKPILLSVVVALRYVPTIRQETGYILQSMKLRGIGFNLKNLFFKPLTTVEYVLIPLLFRSLTIAEELAATGITRGVENPNARTSCFKVGFKFIDFVAISFIFLVVVGLIFLDK